MVNDRKVLWIHAGHRNNLLKRLFSFEHAEPTAQMIFKKYMKLNMLPLGLLRHCLGGQNALIFMLFSG